NSSKKPLIIHCNLTPHVRQANMRPRTVVLVRSSIEEPKGKNEHTAKIFTGREPDEDGLQLRYFGDDLGYAFEFFPLIRPSVHTHAHGNSQPKHGTEKSDAGAQNFARSAWSAAT